MDSETALNLGRAVASLFKNNHRHRIVVGKDTRISGYMLETALASGICSMGADVCLVGPLPTPGIAFITRSMRADAGVVISASHNRYDDNGIKFFDGEGYKLPDEFELKMEEIILTGKCAKDRPTGGKVGKAIRIDDAAGRYIQFLKNAFPPRRLLDGFTIVIDCANGAGYKVAPAVFEELGARVIGIGTIPNGTNINENCGSLHTTKLQEMVRQTGADCGIALDGDADRVIMCDEKGKIVDGDVLMAVCADRMNKNGRLTRSTLVATVMSNIALDNAMQKRGIQIIRTAVGDRYVIQAMRDGGYNLGGEQSGHLIFLDHNTTGDGILGALQILSIMMEEGRHLSEITNIFTPLPQILKNVEVKEKRDFSVIPEINKAIARCERELGKQGRLVIRYSGTENIARIMIEGEHPDRIRDMAASLANLISVHLG
jgi:phosphoglucosamine mutase